MGHEYVRNVLGMCHVCVSGMCQEAARLESKMCQVM